MDFVQKRLHGETLGQYLKSIRIEHKLSIAELAGKTGISQTYIKALESAQYQKIPARVYSVGLLKKIAEVYGLQSHELIEQYEYELQTQREHPPHRFPFSAPFSRLQNFVFTPRILFAMFSTLVILGLVSLAVWQLLKLNRSPELQVVRPQQNEIIKGSTLVVQGTAPGAAQVMVNNQVIQLDSQGEFNTTLAATDGPRVLQIVAENKYGKKAVVEREIIVQQDNATSTTATEATLVLKFIRPAELTIITQMGETTKEQLSAGANKTVIITSPITVTLSDGGAVTATLQNNNLGVLGTSGQPVSIPFSLDNLDTIK